MFGCCCKRSLCAAAALALSASLAWAESGTRVLIAEDPATSDVIIPGGPTPRGDGCSWDNGPVNYGGIANGTQFAPDAFFAQVADTFSLNCESELICEGDANNDGTVDPLDAGFVLARFGCNIADADCQDADQNGDGTVDPLDAGFVLARFGPCPAAGTTGQSLITGITFYSREYNPTCGNPGKWSGIRMVVYNDAGGIPDGEPADDGTIVGGPAVADRTLTPGDYTWTEEVTNGFKVDITTAIVVDNDTTYWLALSPIQPFQGEGQVGWFDTVLDSGGDDIACVQIFAAAGLPVWTPLIDAGSGLPREKAFTLTAMAADSTEGACCTGDSCSEGVDATECSGRFALGGTCGDFSPACGTGACCAADGSCTEGLAGDCTGTFSGAGTTCGSADCPQPPPVNDNCSGAIEVFDGDTNYTTAGATDSGVQDGGDGACLDPFVGFSDAYWVYTATCTGGLEVSLCKACDGDTTVQLYAGDSCDPYGTQIGCGDDTCGIAAGPSVAAACSVTTGDKVLIRIGAWTDGTFTAPTTDGIISITCSTEKQDCCEASSCGGCNDPDIEACVCGIDPFCCDVMWDAVCADLDAFGCGTCP